MSDFTCLGEGNEAEVETRGPRDTGCQRHQGCVFLVSKSLYLTCGKLRPEKEEGLSQGGTRGWSHSQAY